MRETNAQTQLCAVIGNPVEHSLSPVMHNAAFEALRINAVYLAFRVEDVGGCLAGMRALQGFRGMSVTIPHKLAVMEYLDEIEPMAKHVGSVNTITNQNGRLIGSTTDGPGTVRAFEEAGVTLGSQRVLLLGAGGAVRAVAFAMAELGRVKQLTLLGRTASRVATLAADLEAAHLGTQIRQGALETDLEMAMAEHDIIIQGTPMGMYPENIDRTLIPQAWLQPRHVVFDMVYRPMRTRLIREAMEVGCRTIMGLEMLLNQAALQFEQWMGQSAPRTVMRQALLKVLTGESRS